ncbi:MAG TPA: alpha/beta hydrolase [Solirubrobacteraceae bacterium]|jgi:phospholipase/carboxylesterase/glyoxalase family protein|nr:alpha/beta hydrolase [Solirubrobacteraceae bacterium]
MNATTQLGFEHIYYPAPPTPSDWTVLLLHGTGGDEHDLVGLGRQLAPTAALLSPRGKVLEGGMPRFFRRLAVGQLDIPDLLLRTDELAAFVTAAAQAYGRDPGKIAALGFSNGANIAVSLLLRHPALLGAAALLRPMMPYEPEGSLQLPATSVLIAAGEGDPFAAPEQTQRLAEVLGTAGAAVTVHVEPAAGHNLGRGDLRALERWAGDLGAADA